MKKLLISLLSIGVVSAVAIGATSAYFTDTQSVLGNTISTGTLSITDISEDWMMPVTFTNLKPGDLIRKWVRIENDGTLPIHSLTVSAVNVDDPAGLLHQLIGWTYGTIAGTSDDPNGVQTGYNNDSMVLLNNANLLSPANHILLPGQHTTVQVQFVMPEQLGNEWQNKTATFDLLFSAGQI